jgi:hypothetical protein
MALLGWELKPLSRLVWMIVVMLGLMAIMPVPSVYAANPQGLEWGVKGGDRLYYDVICYSIWPSEPYVIPPRATVHERLCVIIKPLTALNKTVTDLQEIVLTNGYYVSNYSVYYMNGSMVGFPLDGSFSPPILAFAVGNWPLVASLVYPASSSGFEAVDNATMWGLKWDVNVTFAMKTYDIYLKSDGALYQHIYELHNLTTGEQVIKIVTNRVNNSETTTETTGTSTLTTNTSTLASTAFSNLSIEIALVSIPIEIAIVVLLITKYRR